ncbi:fimbria/pilus outer membrane usher protein [Novosphingobium panipatense]|uniref:fimbria/pilus outer membrane usher protein n=1 Tax=Novosphingobium panipatense TaxID=428991 RepID=UPI00361FF984
MDKVTRNTGALLNYGVYADIGKDSQASAQYDLRILTRRGVLSTTGFATLADDGNGGVDHTRLDTYWRIVDVRTAIALTLGDTIGSGGGIASAYRLAGIQIQRDFESRPDLVTMALPTLNGTAAVPSTVDLYINGLRYFTGTVGRGPFQFRSLPNIGGGATATVVLTDATGRETRLSKPLFFAPDLLPQGRLDFSVEAGFPRLNYGSESFDYLSRFSGSASVRYGVSDALTLRAHVEGMRGHVMGSLGGTVRLGGFGAISAGASVSRFRERTGRRFVLEGQAHVLGIDFLVGSNARTPAIRPSWEQPHSMPPGARIRWVRSIPACQPIHCQRLTTIRCSLPLRARSIASGQASRSPISASTWPTPMSNWRTSNSVLRTFPRNGPWAQTCRCGSTGSETSRTARIMASQWD